MVEGPDFIGIGVQRGGTTWLSSCLHEHPEVFMPEKEIQFFDVNYDKGVDWYNKKFSNEGGFVAKGEYSPDYFFSKKALDRIFQYNPNVKLILILREPVSRAYSAFNLFKSYGQLSEQKFEHLVEARHRVFAQSLYSEQLAHMLKLFPRHNIYIDFYENIEKEPLAVYKSICEFLELDGAFKPPSLKLIRNSSAYSDIYNKFKIMKFQKFIERTPFAKGFEKLKSTSLMQAFKRKLIRESNKIDILGTLDNDTLKLVLDDVKRIESVASLDCSFWREKYEKALKFGT
jgi:sulfotransferase family protein